MCGATSPTHHHPTLSHPNAKGRVTAHSPPPPSPIQTRRAASPPTRHHLPLPFRREGPRHRPLATTSLSYSDAKGRVTAHRVPTTSLSHPNAKGRVTAHSPPPPSPIQTRRAASPPTRHHLPLPFRREGTRHRPLATTSLSHSDAKGRVTAHRVAPSSLPHSAAKGRVTAHRLATTPL